MNNNSLRQRVIKIFQILKSHNHAPTTELVYSTPFELLVAVILSAQATDISVNKVTKSLYKIANTPQQIIDLGLDNLMHHIKTIGLYKTKAKHVYATCKLLVTSLNSEVPDNFETLITLPGVGRKTANVILNTIFGKPTIAVDTHIFRVSNRLGIAAGTTPLIVEQKLQQIIPQRFKMHAHHWLILHGRYVCKARTPLCAQCNINKYCDTYINMI